jgi:hypothetical protein
MEAKQNLDQEKLTETKLGLDIYRVSIIATMRQVGKAQRNTTTPKLITVAYIVGDRIEPGHALYSFNRHGARYIVQNVLCEVVARSRQHGNRIALGCTQNSDST